MHELGVVWKVVELVEQTAKENNAPHVASVTIQLGKVSGVVPNLLEDCWNWVCTKHEILNNCKLVIEPIEAITYCEDCKQQYDTIKYGKTCPHCQSGNTYLIQGNEFSIKEITVED